MTEDNWTPVAKELPPEDVEVLTMSPNGLVQPLTRRGRLYFADSGMYVYYEVCYWKLIKKS